jgi:predicted nucleic acid-binding protein
VSITDVTGGMRSAERREVWQFLSSFRIEPVTGPAAGRAGEFMRKYRRSHTGIGIADYPIAGTADIRGLQLATLNVRHFPMFDDLTAPFTV